MGKTPNNQKVVFWVWHKTYSCGEALVVELLGSVEYPIMAITPRSTFTWNGSKY